MFMTTFKNLIYAIRKYNEYWFEMKFNGRDYSQEILSQVEIIKHELKLLNLDATDLVFSDNKLVVVYVNESTTRTFEKINAINWFGKISYIKDYVV